MKFSGNTSYGLILIFKKISSSISWTGAFLVKIAKIYENFQNHVN
jgi:hypothetical protein